MTCTHYISASDCCLCLDVPPPLDSSRIKRRFLKTISTCLLVFSFCVLAYYSCHQVVFTHLICSCEGQQFQVQWGPMQINHFILREIIYDVLRWLRIQSPPCSHCHVPCLGLSSVFIRRPAPVLPPLSPESRFIPQIIDYDRLHANREGAKCD